MNHDHEWRRYILRQEGVITVKEYTQMAWEDVPGAYFVDYDCACGAAIVDVC